MYRLFDPVLVYSFLVFRCKFDGVFSTELGQRHGTEHPLTLTKAWRAFISRANNNDKNLIFLNLLRDESTNIVDEYLKQSVLDSAMGASPRKLLNRDFPIADLTAVQSPQIKSVSCMHWLKKHKWLVCCFQPNATAIKQDLMDSDSQRVCKGPPAT